MKGGHIDPSVLKGGRCAESRGRGLIREWHTGPADVEMGRTDSLFRDRGKRKIKQGSRKSRGGKASVQARGQRSGCPWNWTMGMEYERRKLASTQQAILQCSVD